MRRFSYLIALALGLAASGRTQADVKTHTLFADHAVLQQGIKVPVWGTAEPGEKVTVKFGGQEVSATAKDDGKWRVDLAPLKASNQPAEMTIAGKNTVTVKDLLVGEVWICSGQSNMEWSMNSTRDPQKNIGEAKYPEIRLFRTPKAMTGKPLADFPPTKNAEGKWTDCNPKDVAGFSAVAYFFGRKLHVDNKVPVGLIQTAWGGTAAELWTRAEVFGQYAELKGSSGSSLYNAMIAPLIPYAIQGAIWYQGESNVGKAWQYRTLFPAMIKNWREDWKQGDFPFLFVQIAPYGPYKTEAAAVLREAQLFTAQTVPNSAMVVITDYGDEFDIHPLDKDPVGVRLALCAQALAYKKNIPYSGPEYASQKVEGNKIVLTFKHAQGLVAKELKISVKRTSVVEVKGGTLPGFTIAGKDGKFVDAEAKIVGDTVVVSSAAVAEPVGVRYGWSANPVINLFNGAGLPASPFRSDNFLVPTQPALK